MARNKEAISTRRLKEFEALKLWLAQCDAHTDGAKADYEWLGAACFVTGTVFDGRRVTVQVGWDEKGAYAWSGCKYRFAKSEMRAHGALVLERV